MCNTADCANKELCGRCTMGAKAGLFHKKIIRPCCDCVKPCAEHRAIKERAKV